MVINIRYNKENLFDIEYKSDNNGDIKNILHSSVDVECYSEVLHRVLTENIVDYRGFMINCIKLTYIREYFYETSRFKTEKELKLYIKDKMDFINKEYPMLELTWNED